MNKNNPSLKPEIQTPKSDDVTLKMLEKIWARRAARLAQALVEAEAGEPVDIAVIRLGRELYGLSGQYVFDIRPIELKSITRVPRAPEWVAGVVNLRGRVLSALDLRRFLGLAAYSGREQTADSPPHAETAQAESGGGAYLIVVETPTLPDQTGIEIALLADDVLAVETTLESKIQNAVGAVRGIRPEYVWGIADYAESSMVVLDLPVLLADKQLIVHEEIA